MERAGRTEQSRGGGRTRRRRWATRRPEKTRQKGASGQRGVEEGLSGWRGRMEAGRRDPARSRGGGAVESGGRRSDTMAAEVEELAGTSHGGMGRRRRQAGGVGGWEWKGNVRVVVLLYMGF
jgi:hypothetical protein